MHACLVPSHAPVSSSCILCVFSHPQCAVGASNFVILFGLCGHERRFCLIFALMFERMKLATTYERIGKDSFYIFNFIQYKMCVNYVLPTKLLTGRNPKCNETTGPNCTVASSSSVTRRVLSEISTESQIQIPSHEGLICD